MPLQNTARPWNKGPRGKWGLCAPDHTMLTGTLTKEGVLHVGDGSHLSFPLPPPGLLCVTAREALGPGAGGGQALEQLRHLPEADLVGAVVHHAGLGDGLGGAERITTETGVRGSPPCPPTGRAGYTHPLACNPGPGGGSRCQNPCFLRSPATPGRGVGAFPFQATK